MLGEPGIMSPVRSLRSNRVHVPIPPQDDPIFKIEVEDSITGVKTDVTDDMISGEYTDGVTETIGNFSFSLENSDQSYTDVVGLNDQVNIYMDYATEATTLTFSGIIEKPSTANNKLTLMGRSPALKIMDTKVTRSYDNVFTHEIYQDIVDNYGSGVITTNNLDTTEATDLLVTINWSQKPFWECVQDLCVRSGYDSYIDKDSDVNYFVSGTIINSTDAVIHGNNLVETGDFAPDISVMRNRITVYGASLEGIQIFWTEEDSTSITTYGLKEERITDSSIVSTSQAKDRAIYELAIRKDPPIIGEVISLGTPTLLPGQKLYISDPMNNLDPTYYPVQKFTHIFSNDEPMKTIITINKERTTIPKILKKRITFEIEDPDTENPNEFKFSYANSFSEDSGSHTDTEIVDGVLRLVSGESTGTWISSIIPLDSGLVTAGMELRVNGDSISGSVYSVSTDGGSSYLVISSPKVVINPTPGNSILLKVVLNSSSAQLKAAGIYYNTTSL